MDIEGYKKKVKNIPSNPGVYFFLGKRKEILYIGKATSLRSRIRSYLDTRLTEKRSPVIEKMVYEAIQVEWEATDSVLEAMLLEVNLIRTHKPTYNTQSKDDKSFNHLVITNDEFPRVLVVRGKDLVNVHARDSYRYIYGPFPSAGLFKEALKLIRRLFQFYDTHKPIGSENNKMIKGKIDFNRQIGLYPEMCSREEYARTIKHIRFFFEGKKKKILVELEQAMLTHAKKEEFEQANLLKKKIFALKHIHDVSLLKDESRLYRDRTHIRIEAYDVAHMGGMSMVGVMTVFSGDESVKSAYRKFIIKGFEHADDVGALQEVLNRRFNHPEWGYPDLIVVDGSTAQRNGALQILKAHKKVIPVVGVVKDEKHNPKRIIGPTELVKEYKAVILHANAEAHRFAIVFHRSKRSKSFL